MLNVVFKATRLKSTELDKNFIFNVIENILAILATKRTIFHNIYTFFNENSLFFTENKMYYRECDTLLPRMRHTTTENATRSIFHKVPRKWRQNAKYLGG